MKSKNGFTLIELLAIIVILAIIAVITVPIILNIIDDAEKNSSIDSAHGYKDALQKYYATKSVQNSELELPNGYIEISELPSDFTVSGENPSDGWVKLKNGIVEKYSLKYKDYVVTMDSDKNIVSEKQQSVEPHVTNNYQEVEYIESNGTQYIDTGYIPKHEDYLELKNVTRKSEGALFSAGTGDYQLIYLNAGSNNYFKFFATGAAAHFQLGSNFNSKNIKVYNNNLYIDDQLYTTSNPIGDVNTDLRLFARANGGNYINAQIGNVIIKSDNSLVRNLVPVVRKSDNKPGMLDLANLSKNLFFSNKTQTNNFATGNIKQTIEKSEFIVNRNTTTENDASATVYIDLTLPAGTYTLSVEGMNLYGELNTDRIFLRDIDGTVVINNVQTGKPRTFTLSETTNINRISFVFNAQSTYDNQLVRVMLNEGSTALPYETYKDVFYTNAGEGEFIAGPEL